MFGRISRTHLAGCLTHIQQDFSHISLACIWRDFSHTSGRITRAHLAGFLAYIQQDFLHASSGISRIYLQRDFSHASNGISRIIYYIQRSRMHLMGFLAYIQRDFSHTSGRISCMHLVGFLARIQGTRIQWNFAHASSGISRSMSSRKFLVRIQQDFLHKFKLGGFLVHKYQLQIKVSHLWYNTNLQSYDFGFSVKSTSVAFNSNLHRLN